MTGSRGTYGWHDEEANKKEWRAEARWRREGEKGEKGENHGHEEEKEDGE